MKIKKLLSVCLVIGIIASLYPVCTFATEESTEKYVTIYEQDFTSANATTDGWTTGNMTITSRGLGNEYIAGDDAFGAESSMYGSEDGYVMFNQDLGNDYKVSGTINYSGNFGSFYLNTDGNIILEEGDAQYIKPQNGYGIKQNKINLSAGLVVDGNWGWNQYQFTDLWEKDNDTKDIDGTDVDFEITYNNGRITYLSKCDSGVINSFDFNLDEFTGDATRFESGKFMLTEGSYSYWIKNIKIEKVMPEYVTVYEQDFTQSGATADGWITENMSVTSNGLGNEYTAGNDAFASQNEYGSEDGYAIYNDDLGTKYKVSGTINYSGNFGSFIINSGGEALIENEIEEGINKNNLVKVTDGYKITQNKKHTSAGILTDKNWGYDLTQNQFADVWEKENTTKDIDGVDVDFEIEYDNGKITYICKCGENIINSFEYNLTTFEDEIRYESGKFVLTEGSYSYWIKDIKIEKASSEYVTLYEQDFTQSGATADGWIVENMSVTSNGLGNEYVEGDDSFGASVNSYGSEDGYAIFNQNLGENYKISGTVNYSGNFGSFYLNTDGNVNFERGDNQYIKPQNGYGINQNKINLSAGLVVDGNWGWNQYQFTDLWEKANVTSGIDSVDVNFELAYNNGKITYICKCESGVINSFEFDLEEFSGDTTRFENGRFMLVESSYSYWIKNIKIETVSEYAISDVKATNDNGEISYSALVYNWDGSLNDPALIAAVFDANGVMIDAKLIDYDGTAGINSVSGTITVDSEKVPDNVTIFFWQNLDKAAPLCDFKTCQL